MFGRIRIENNILTIFPVKITKIIYWVTTPHYCQISSEKNYTVLYDNNTYQAKLIKQAYFCDLALFKIDNFNGNIKTIKIIKSKNTLLNKKLILNKKPGFYIENYFTPYLDIDGGSRQLFYLCKFEEKVNPGDSGTPIYNEDNELVGIISITKEGKTYLVPGFLITKLINCINYKIIPYVPLTLTMNRDDKIVVLESEVLQKGDIITKLNNYTIKKDTIYSKKLKDWIPIDTYILLCCLDSPFINITIDNEVTYRLKINDMNKFLKYPFDPKITNKNSYQSLFKKKKLNYRLVKNNLMR